MSNQETAIGIYFILNLLIMMLAVVAIVIGVFLNDTITIMVGAFWLVIAFFRLVLVLNVKNDTETRPLISKA